MFSQPSPKLTGIKKPNASQLLTENEQFNNTNSPFDETKFIHEQFHELAQQYPEKIAVTFHDAQQKATSITYAELDKQSTQLANHLISKGIQLNDYIGIQLPRSILLIITTLAVFKAGGVMVTMETDNKERRNQKIKDNQIKQIITDSASFGEFQNSSPYTLINIETFDFQQASDAYKAPKLNAMDPAYVMYTSGSSTGTPLGALNTHYALMNLIHALTNTPPHRNILSSAPATFDAWLFDLAVMIRTAGELHFIYDQGRYNPTILSTVIVNHGINYAVLLPEVLKGLDPKTLPLQHVISMGEVPNKEVMQKWYDAKIDIMNGYGLTEAGICDTLHCYNPTEATTLIGKPIANMQIFILNDDLALCKEGVTGEIYIASKAIALGYVNAPEATKNKFLTMTYDERTQQYKHANPSHPNAIRLYKTGDMGCYKLGKNGLEIDFHGRKDREIKLQGVRINLNYVESVILKHTEIDKVIIQPNQNKTALSAYIILKNPQAELDNKQLRVYLEKTDLPKVAYPVSLAILKVFPLTQNGKIDTKTLQQTTSVTSPTTALQTAIRNIWAEELGIDKNAIGIDATFSELGGTSLIFSQMEIKLTRHLNSHSHSLNIQNNLSLLELLMKDMSIMKLAKCIQEIPSKKKRTLIAAPTFSGHPTLVFNNKPTLKPQANNSNNPLKFSQK